jgi:acetyl esterase/lipase
MSASRILPKEPLPPTLILFGDLDYLAQYQNAFVDKAKEAGKHFELKVYKGGGHSFMTPPVFEKKSTQDVEAFVRRRRFLPDGGD